jgi:hypothetical protein
MRLNPSLVPAKPFVLRRGNYGIHAIHATNLAIDPGLHTGWARFDGCSLVACGSGEPPFLGARRVVIELPQIYPSNPVPPNDLVTLAFLAGRYAEAAREAAVGAEVFTVLPHAWKGDLPKKVCADRVRSRLSPGESLVLEQCGVPKGQLHNVLDAIGIGQFAFGAVK